MTPQNGNAYLSTIRPRIGGVYIGVTFAILSILLIIILMAQLITVPNVKLSSSWQLFSDKRLINTFAVSVYQAGLSTIFSLAIGGVLAWALAAQSEFNFRRLLVALISSALVLPTLVVILGIVSIYGRNGWLNELFRLFGGNQLPFSIYGLGGILLAHCFFNASLAARIFLLRLEAVGEDKRKLAIGLNLNPWQKMKFVDLPAIYPVIPSLAVTIFLLCFTSFAIVLTLAGSPAYNTLEVAIYEAVKFEFDLEKAFQLALVQVVFGAVLVFTFNRQSLDRSFITSHSQIFPANRFQKRPENFLQGLIIFIFAVFFLLPLFAVIYDGLSASIGDLFASGIFWRSLFTSLSIAFFSTLLVLLMASTIARALATLSSRSNQRKWNITVLLSALLRFSAMVYLVVPALVMGLGFFLLHLKLGGNNILWAGVVLVIANAMIAMPFAIAALHPAFEKCALAHDRLGQGLGMTIRQQFLRVDWPALKNDYYYVCALAFSFSLGDLGVIALFGSDEFRTLPWLLFQKFGSYQTQDASAIALVLLVMVASLFAFANRQSGFVRFGPTR